MSETESTALPPQQAQIPTEEEGVELICSARRCRHDATWGLKWNNPKIHTPDRRKVWLACDDHLERLTDFLADRGFLCETVAIADL